MKIVLAGAFGNLGAELLKALIKEGHEVVAADLREAAVEGCEGKYTFKQIDATDPHYHSPSPHLSSQQGRKEVKEIYNGFHY